MPGGERSRSSRRAKGTCSTGSFAVASTRKPKKSMLACGWVGEGEAQEEECVGEGEAQGEEGGEEGRVSALLYRFAARLPGGPVRT